MPAVILGAPAFTQQNVIADAGNTSTATINAGATFTGAWHSTLGVNSIQVTLVCSKNATVYIDQGSDGATVDVTDSFLYNFIRGNFGTTVQAVSAYYRIRVTNTCPANATTVRLATFLCPIAEPLPRSLDADGNSRSAIYRVQDHFGNNWRINTLGCADVNQPYRLVGSNFGTTAEGIDANFWTASTSGTGATASIATAGVCSLKSTSSGAGYAQIVTVRRGRFIYTSPHRCRMRVRIPTLSIAGTTYTWGAYTVTSAPTPYEGFVWSVDAANVLTLNCYSGGAVVATATNGAFNGVASYVVLDTNVHSYDILYSMGAITFVIDDVKIHTFTPTTVQLSGTYILPVMAACVGTGTQAQLDVWAGAIARLGRDESSAIAKHIAGANAGVLLKSGAGRLQRLVINASSAATTVSIYDALSAANSLALIVAPAATTPVTLDYHMDFYTGLWVVTVGGPTDVTFILE